ncbi:DUF6371 domain-containing protein [Natronospira bacteriovora]|uniref:DUF6371 domain-containing protein n=1 Tax=Natronospira bacteriovora TaxID=3069753 RepID=A0ABU0W4W1_9GAMM|nr:DUF6371 domain-containing protein [Natronospira sp. AB-CW4]MDQ2069057.1 DUF6371 domain-containing protein [Natronospira sp. AB-CW4]
MSELNQTMPQVAETLLGDRNPRLSNNGEWRFGRQGSLAVNLATGTFYDHERGEGGGVLDLVQSYGQARNRNDAARWVRERFGGGDTWTPRPKPERKAPKPVELTAPRGVNPPTSRPDRHPSLGKPSRIYTYHDGGAPILCLYRFDTPQGKEVRQAIPTAEGWEWKGLPKGVARPLYEVEWLSMYSDCPVILVEGEKAAEAATAHFPKAFCTTWAGGCSGASKAYIEPLRGREVVLWPDNDDAGVKAMGTIAERLKGVARNIRWVTLPDWLPPKTDAADFTTDQARDLVATAYGRDAPDPFPDLPSPTPNETAEDCAGDDEAFDCDEDGEELIPEGEYTARYQWHAVREYRGSNGKFPKVQMRFVLVDGFPGLELDAFYNCKLPPGRTKKGARPTLGKKSDLKRQLRAIARQRGLKRKSGRLSPAILRGVDLRVKVQTVTEGWAGSDNYGDDYSKVAAIIGLKEAANHAPQPAESRA